MFVGLGESKQVCSESGYFSMRIRAVLLMRTGGAGIERGTDCRGLIAS